MASLRALECLVAVADTGSITQAARLLHSSQPAVSHQLAALERETRTALLHREARGVRLTPAGRAAVADARRAIEAASAAVRAARAAGEATGGTLRLACAQSLTVPMLAPVIRSWHRRHPRVAISLLESAAPGELFGAIDSGEADVLLVPGPVSERFPSTVVASTPVATTPIATTPIATTPIATTPIASTPIASTPIASILVAEEEIVLTAPTGHRLARQPTVSLSDLDGERLVHYAPENGLSSWLDWSFSRAGIRPEPVMRTSVTSAAPQLAAAGLGVAVSPVSAVSAGFPGVVRSFSPRWSRQVVAVTPAASEPLAARFIADLRARGLRVPRDVQAQLTAR